jgi:hypothetical protein
MPDWKTLILITGTAFSIFFFNETRYADSAAVEQVAVRLEHKIVSDQLKSVQGRIWALEDRYRGKDLPTSVFEELRLLKEEKEKLKEGLKNIKH